MTVAISVYYTFDSSSERQVFTFAIVMNKLSFKFFDLIQRYIQQLNQAEEHLIEISDLFDHEALAGPARIIENIRLQIQQLRVNLNFLSSMKLLHACRQVQRHLQVHGNLPLFNLDFN